MASEDDVKTTPVLGVILLDSEGYTGIEAECTPHDEVGVGWMPPGHLEHPRSWGCDTIYRVARGCTPDASAMASPEAFQGVREAAAALDGRVDLITSDCAYTWFVREALSGTATPAMSSSLALLDLARTVGERVAIVASSAEVLGSLLGEPPAGVRIVGLDGKPEWTRYQTYTIHTDPPLDRAQMAHELLERLDEDFRDNSAPDVILLECTGLPQFRQVIRARFDGPILDIASFVQYMLDVEPSANGQFVIDQGPATVAEPS